MIRNTKGFTLIELMVVILIVGILAALAIPKFTNASVKAKLTEVPTVTAGYENAQLAHIAENGTLGLVAALVFDAPTTSKWFNWLDGAAAGTYNGTVQANKPIGDVPAGTVLSTTLTAAGVITHATTAQQAYISKMIPNWINPN